MLAPKCWLLVLFWINTKKTRTSKVYTLLKVLKGVWCVVDGKTSFLHTKSRVCDTVT